MTQKVYGWPERPPGYRGGQRFYSPWRMGLIALGIALMGAAGIALGVGLSEHANTPTRDVIRACEDAVLVQPTGMVTGGFSAERASPSMLDTFLVQGNVVTTQGLRQWTCTARQDGSGEWVAIALDVQGVS
jgi:hypothetical protein